MEALVIERLQIYTKYGHMLIKPINEQQKN